jgi:hypothetical protein
MQRLEIDVPDDLAEGLAPYRDRLADVLRLGLQQMDARGGRPPAEQGHDRTSDADESRVPALVARLDRRRAALTQIRDVEESAEVIRGAREDRARAL